MNTKFHSFLKFLIKLWDTFHITLISCSRSTKANSHFPQILTNQEILTLFLDAPWIFFFLLRGGEHGQLFFFFLNHAILRRLGGREGLRESVHSMTIHDAVGQFHFELIYQQNSIRLNKVICDLSKHTWHQTQHALQVPSLKALCDSTVWQDKLLCFYEISYHHETKEKKKSVNLNQRINVDVLAVRFLI